MKIIRRAIKAYPNRPYLDKRSVKHLRLGWMRSMEMLGDRHILAKQVQRWTMTAG